MQEKYTENSLRDFIVSELDKRGLKVIDKPEIDIAIKQKCEPFPTNLTIVADNHLGILSSYYGSMWTYAYNQLSLTEIQLLYAENAYDFYYHQAVIKEGVDYSIKKVLKSVIDARVANDVDVIKWVKRIQIYKAKTKMLKALMNSYDRYYEVVSREVYRRTNLIRKGV